MFLGLRTIIYPAPDLEASKRWWTGVLGFDPYFDEPFFVGFAVGGYELGLDPNADPSEGPRTYWGVRNLDTALAKLLAAGATIREEPAEVGGGIRVATVENAFGSVVGVIENPEFELHQVTTTEDGTGR